MGKVAGVLFGLGFFFLASIGSVGVLLPCAIVLLPFVPFGGVAAFRQIARLVAAGVFTFAAAMLEVIGGVKVHCGGDAKAMASDKRVLVVANHHCHVDWMFIWCLAARHAAAGRVIIVAKDDLKSIPVLGWIMQCFVLVFVSRKDRARDVARLGAAIRYHADSKLWALVFPEGTDLSESNVEKSQHFGKLMKPPRVWSNVLIPRGAGTAAMIRELGTFDAIYDVTVRYPGSEQRPSERRLLTGQFPPAARLDLERFAYADLPAAVRDGEDAAVTQWVLDRFEVKESALASEPPAGAEPTAAPWATYYAVLAVGYASALAACAAFYSSGQLRMAVVIACIGWNSFARRNIGMDDVLLKLDRTPRLSWSHLLPELKDLVQKLVVRFGPAKATKAD